MITTIDEEDCWFWCDGDFIYNEKGLRREVKTSDIIFTHGKYVGSRLDEVSDSWYLKFIKEKNKDDYFISKLFEKRLGELQ